MTPVAPLVEAFFTERLFKQRQASPHTVSAYRDTFRLLLAFAKQKLGKAPSQLHVDDLDAQFIASFLDHLQAKRGNSASTRNARLAAIRSFFRYVALEEPAHVGLVQRVLGIPQKRSDRNLIGFLTRSEMEALLAAPATSTWIGRRDHALLLVAVQTGLRVSELIGLSPEQLVLAAGPHVRCRGKGRKERCTPLTKQTVKVLRAWLKERQGGHADPLFPTRRGTRLSRDAVERLVTKYADAASATCASIAKKRVTPHVLRHTTAVHLLQAGVDRSVIALWLGHESVETTQMYLDADLSTKEAALEKTRPTNSRAARRYAPGDRLVAFLTSL
jgi:integrase/recombinase XerD